MLVCLDVVVVDTGFGGGVDDRNQHHSQSHRIALFCEEKKKMSQKRQQEDGKARPENCPEDKRRKGLTFKKLVSFFLFDFSLVDCFW